MVLAKLVTKFRGKKDELASKTFDPDERWSNLYREREKNNIYKWVGTKNGGELLAIYEKEGEEGVLNFAQEKLEPMLYNEGQSPQLIKFADYIRWKKSMNVILGITNDDELSESNSYFREHEAQTRLNKRGVEGETLMHLLLARKEPTCREIARILINKYPGLAKDIYLGKEMFGQTGLHLAVVHEDYEMVQLLLEQGASVNGRATGDFFMPDHYGRSDSKATDYNGYAYYGEYPLAFSACFEHKDIYDLLIQYGANPDLQDMFGNTVLHMCVIYNKNTMYSYAVRHWHKPAHTHIVNYVGQTPLTLATKLGRREIFDEMLELMKVEFWRFSDMTCSAYPLDALDTIRLDGTTNYDSALITVVNGDEPDHLNMIGSEVIQRLLMDKWKAFAERKLYERLALLLLQLFNLCFVVYLRPVTLQQLYMAEPDLQDWIRSVFELVGILCCVWFLFVQQLSDLRNQGFYAYYQNIRTAPPKVVYIGANLCFMACVPARILQMYELEETLLALALPGSWAFLLFFLSSTKLIGPFVQIFYDMLSKDIVRYAIISFIFLIAFSEVFYFLGKDATAIQAVSLSAGGQCNTGGRIYSFETFLDSFMTLYSLMVQASAMNFDEYSCTNYVELGKLVLIIYLATIPIMMMNILIAMMEQTYIEIIEHAEKAWRQQYAKLIMVLERSLDSRKLTACQLDYSIRMNEPGRESRGLMVIKQTTKTRAFQRKQAIANWKMMGRKVITMVRELGTEAIRYLLHTIDQMVTEETVGVGRGTSYGNAPWKALMRPQSSALSSLKGEGATAKSDQQPIGGQHTVEILQIEHPYHPDPVDTYTGQLQLSINFSQIVQQRDVNGGRMVKRQMIISGVSIDPRVANGLPERMSASDIQLRVPPATERQYAHIIQRQLLMAQPLGSRVRGVEMAPSDVPNMPATDMSQQNAPREDEGPNLRTKRKLGPLQKSASVSTISTASSCKEG